MVRLKDTVSQCQEFPHRGTDDHFAGFALGLEPFAEGPHDRVMLADRLRGLNLVTSCPVSGPMISRGFRLMRVRSESRYKVGLRR